MPVAKYVEFLTPSPYVDDLIAPPSTPTPTAPDAPDKPGLGIELNREMLKKFGG